MSVPFRQPVTSSQTPLPTQTREAADRSVPRVRATKTRPVGPQQQETLGKQAPASLTKPLSQTKNTGLLLTPRLY